MPAKMPRFNLSAEGGNMDLGCLGIPAKRLPDNGLPSVVSWLSQKRSDGGAFLGTTLMPSAFFRNILILSS
jgi:hypothetical protein